MGATARRHAKWSRDRTTADASADCSTTKTTTTSTTTDATDATDTTDATAAKITKRWNR